MRRSFEDRTTMLDKSALSWWEGQRINSRKTEYYFRSCKLSLRRSKLRNIRSIFQLVKTQVWSWNLSGTKIWTRKTNNLLVFLTGILSKIILTSSWLLSDKFSKMSNPSLSFFISGSHYNSWIKCLIRDA